MTASEHNPPSPPSQTATGKQTKSESSNGTLPTPSALVRGEKQTGTTLQDYMTKYQRNTASSHALHADVSSSN